MKMTYSAFLLRHFFLFGALFLTACDAYSENVGPGDSDYPIKNSAPKKFLNIRGVVDPSLDLVFKTSWSASNPDCKYYTSRIEGATNPYSITDPLPVDQNGESIVAKVAVDGMLPGRCGWKFSGISMSSKSGGFGQSLVQTNTDPSSLGTSPNGIINLKCERHMRTTPPLVPELDCRWIEPEDQKASVRGGILWWRPETTELQFNIHRGICKLAWCTDADK